MNLQNLKNTIPFKWRVQSFSKNKAKAQCVAYIDARQAMDLFDSVCGAENWQSDYKVINGNLYAGIGIYINNQWIWKWDCGTESNMEKEKGESSDAFKRAAVKWGVGRFLYNMSIQYVDANEKKTNSNYPYCIDSNGNRIWNITKFINDKLGNNTPKQSLSQKPIKKLSIDDSNKRPLDSLESSYGKNAIKGIKEGKVKNMTDLEKHFIMSDNVRTQLQILLQAQSK